VKNAHLPFDRPFENLRVLSNVEGLMALSNVEGRRCPHHREVTSDESRVTSSFFDLVTCPSTLLRAVSLSNGYSSLVTDMGALYLGIFEQPEDSEDAQKIS
jgi:hypothetical protein